MTISFDYTKKELFKAYNQARATISKLNGKSLDGKSIDVARLNRAFGILQTRGYNFNRYQTSVGSCSCPDSQNGYVCKHRIAYTVALKIQKGRA